MRGYAQAFEGDDRIATITGTLSEGQLAEAEAHWQWWGFNMKLYARKRVAEFTG